MKSIVYQSNYWYNDGLRKAQTRDMSGAVASLRKSLQFNRENIAARNLLGLVYYGIGEVPTALVEWIISKNLQPRDNIANYYIEKVQDSAKELEVVNLAIKKFNQCLVYCRQNGEDLAIIQLKQIISAHPSFLKAYQLLALLYLHTGQHSRARQILRRARKLDTFNEMTLRYLRELTQQRGKYRRDKKKDDVVEYNMGNETIIQPKHSRVREMSAHFSIMNIFIGAVIGAAIIWFLVAPAVNEHSSDKMNDQMRDYSEQIKTLEAQVSAQTRTLDNYRASGEEAQADADRAQTTVGSYEDLLTVSSQYSSGQYSYSTMADTLLKVNRDLLGDSGKEEFDNLSEYIYPGACATELANGTQSMYAEDYQGAIDAFKKVISMDEGYNDGQALYNLGEAYMENNDTENATSCFQKLIKNYPDSQYAEQAQDSLDEISNAGSDENGNDQSEDTGTDNSQE